MAVIGGWEIFTRNGEKTGIEGGEGGGWFNNGGMGNF